MRILNICFFFLCAPVMAGTLCKSSEKVVFSCQIKSTGRIASVCSSTRLTHDEGYLQYRYGTPESIELVYPSTKDRTQDHFYWGKTHVYGGSVSDLSFMSGKYLYTLDRSGGSEELNGIPGGSYGGYIQVSRLGGVSKLNEVLQCTSYPQGSFDLSGIVRDDAELIGR